MHARKTRLAACDVLRPCVHRVDVCDTSRSTSSKRAGTVPRTDIHDRWCHMGEDVHHVCGRKSWRLVPPQHTSRIVQEERRRSTTTTTRWNKGGTGGTTATDARRNRTADGWRDEGIKHGQTKRKNEVWAELCVTRQWTQIDTAWEGPPEMPRHIPVLPPCQSGMGAFASNVRTVVASLLCPSIFSMQPLSDGHHCFRSNQSKMASSSIRGSNKLGPNADKSNRSRIKFSKTSSRSVSPMSTAPCIRPRYKRTRTKVAASPSVLGSPDLQ
mmetsp:Transcript_6280/g.22085  ORF Transcript_6280/g.22085 Transcript_6280/m.22085 type:complete len:270 (-) Transcript_6280:490-1299(-)